MYTFNWLRYACVLGHFIRMDNATFSIEFASFPWYKLAFQQNVPGMVWGAYRRVSGSMCVP